MKTKILLKTLENIVWFNEYVDILTEGRSISLCLIIRQVSEHLSTDLFWGSWREKKKKRRNEEMSLISSLARTVFMISTVEPCSDLQSCSFQTSNQISALFTEVSFREVYLNNFIFIFWEWVSLAKRPLHLSSSHTTFKEDQPLFLVYIKHLKKQISHLHFVDTSTMKTCNLNVGGRKKEPVESGVKQTVKAPSTCKYQQTAF